MGKKDKKAKKAKKRARRLACGETGRAGVALAVRAASDGGIACASSACGDGANETRSLACCGERGLAPARRPQLPPRDARYRHIAEVPCMAEFVRLCLDGYRAGWHEYNGGNLSYRMGADDVAACRPFMETASGPWVEAGVCEPDLAGSFFAVTAAGSCLRNAAVDPEHTFGIVCLDERGAAWRRVWGFADGGRPTSEFATHLACHAARMKATDGKMRVLYHAHTPNAAALTTALEPSDRCVTRALWRASTESALVFPEGVGALAFMAPGGIELACATRAKMETYAAVLWAHHGLICAGASFDAALGLTQAIEKAAQVYRYACQMNGEHDNFKQMLGDDDLRAIADAHGVTLCAQFLG